MKKKIVEVDEDVLKEIHCRRHTCFRQGQPRPERKVRGTSGSEKSAATVPADTPVEKPAVEKPKRKKDETFGYRERFSGQHTRVNRSHVYINRGSGRVH